MQCGIGLWKQKRQLEKTENLNKVYSLVNNIVEYFIIIVTNVSYWGIMLIVEKIKCEYMESIVSSQSFSHCTHTHGGRDTEYTLQPLKKNICKISCLCFFFWKRAIRWKSYTFSF
jgi:hypothetical protein